MSRLNVLLRRFNLSGGATQQDLRKAYYREAKRKHPDVQPESRRQKAEKEFVELREDFEEAMKLLDGGSSGQDSNPYANPWGSEAWQQPAWKWQERDPNDKRNWSTASWATDSHAERPKRTWNWRSREPPRSPEGVPVVGFPAQVVYPLSAAMLLILATMLIPNPDSSSEKEKEKEKLQQQREQQRRSMQAARDRELEGSRAGFGYSNSSTSSSSSSGGGGSNPDAWARSDPLVLELVQREPGIEFSHAAASLGRIWWLERCNASERCRPTLKADDFKGDTPLHHAAKKGYVGTCQVLLRMGAGGLSQRNRYGLAPEQLADHFGFNELATTLREVRKGNILRDCSRHLDGLGVFPQNLEPLIQEGIFTAAAPSESLRHALNLALGKPLLRNKVQYQVEVHLKKKDYTGVNARRQVEVPDDAVVSAAVAKAEEVLQGLGPGFGLQAVDKADIGPDVLRKLAAWWRTPLGGASTKVYGVLLFEPTGAVTKDSEAHWIAMRSVPMSTSSKAKDVPTAQEKIWRLDSVRGPFELTGPEALELLQRYQTWWILGPSEVGPSVGKRSFPPVDGNELPIEAAAPPADASGRQPPPPPPPPGK